MWFTSLLRRRGIGANCYLLDLEGTRILLDAGMDPTQEGEAALPQLEALDYDSLDAIILSHSHLDHIGAMPVAARQHPGAEIFSSPRHQGPRQGHGAQFRQRHVP